MERIILNHADYDGGQVIADWQPLEEAASYEMLVADARGKVIARWISTGPTDSGAVPLQEPLDPLKRYTLRVLAKKKAVTMGASDVVRLISALPELLTAVYDGTAIRATWRVMQPRARGIMGYTLVCTAAGEIVSEQEIGDPFAESGAIQLDAPLKNRKTNQLFLFATDGGLVSSQSAPLTLITEQPTLLAADYTGESIPASWRAPTGVSGLTGYTLVCRADAGGPVYSLHVDNPLATNGVLTLPAPLDSAQAYTFHVVAETESGVGGATNPAPVITRQPVPYQVRYDGKAVTALWQPIFPSLVMPDSYTLTVYSPTGGDPVKTTINNPYATSGSVSLDDPLDPSVAYEFTVTAQAQGAVGSRSTPTPLIAKQPTLLQAAFDGQKLAAQWSPVTGTSTPVAGYTMRCYSPTGGDTISKVIQNPYATNGTLEFTEPLNPSVEYVLTISADAASVVSAATQPETLMTRQPVLSQADYNGTSIRATWQPVTGGAVTPTQYVLKTYSPTGGDSISTTILNAFATNGALSLPAPLNPSFEHVFVVSAQAGVVSASNKPEPLITALPETVEAAYDLKQVTCGWSQPAGVGPAIAGYELKVYSPTGCDVLTSRIDDPMQREGAVPTDSSLDPGVTWVQVTQARGTGKATASGPELQLIVAQPKITRTLYDDNFTRVTWDLTNNPQVAGYHLSLFQGDIRLAHRHVRGNHTPSREATGWLQGPLDPKSAYNVHLRATGNRVSGPVTTVPAVSFIPNIYVAKLSGGELNISLAENALHPHGVSGYWVQIEQDGTVMESFVAHQDRDTLQVPVDLTPGKSYQLRIQAGDEQKQSGGPNTAPITLIQGTPTITSVLYEDGVLRAAWTPVPDPGVTGYELALGWVDANGMPQVMAKASHKPDVICQADLNTGIVYEARVFAVGQNAEGPTSKPYSFFVNQLEEEGQYVKRDHADV